MDDEWLKVPTISQRGRARDNKGGEVGGRTQHGGRWGGFRVSKGAGGGGRRFT